ncbi:extracellular calcium-sensing receptor-like [Hemicordylus capensis]|uniref:extracellular calcium-sensing receptor-like n=1 Tax=Hemicordylus capensis TaxID=884348 RepID=UPI0023042386|nr:extracellular calcium-sensing receptor-like [Hemicordylus capensis]
MGALERGGDILIGGLFPLHFHTLSDPVSIPFTKPPSPTHCYRTIQCQGLLPAKLSYSSGPASGSHSGHSSSLSLWFYKYIQTMVFAIEEINQDPDLLPNLTLGFQIFDSCHTVSRTLLGTMQFLTGRPKAIPNFRCQLHPPQAGIIGESGIPESRTIARILGLYKYPQVSYFATGPVTHDGSQFLSFFRSVPSNKLQARGLAQLVIYFGWTWVGLLAEDSEYGKQGLDIVQEEIAKKGVCIAFSHLLPKSPNEDSITQAARAITESRARVIVTFCGSEALPLLRQLYSQGVAGWVWLCSESMSYLSMFKGEKALRMLNGSLSLSPHKEPVPGLRDFILKLHPSRSPEDVFTQQLWSVVFNCRWNASSWEGGNGPKTCTGEEDLRNGTNRLLSMMGFGMTFNVHNAVYAIAHAVHNMVQDAPRGSKALVNKIRAASQGFSSWKHTINVSPPPHPHPPTHSQFLQYLKTVRFRNKVGEDISFDEDGDPPAALFDVLNTRLPNITLVGRIAFGFSQNDELTLNDSAIVWTGGSTAIPVSVCSPSCLLGYHRSHHHPEKSTCCFDCVPCAKGEISNQTDSSSCSRCPEDQWPNEGQTRCRPKRELFLSFREPLGAGLASVSVCSSLLPVLILALFITHRETPLVRANSRELSYLLLAGLALSFLGCLLFLGRPTRGTCFLRQAAFGLIFALCLSCLLAKTLVVVAAFQATRPGSYARLWLDPRTPRAMVLLGCLPQFLLCAAWLAASPPSLKRDTRSVPHAISLVCDEGSQVAFWSLLAYLCLLAGLAFTGAFWARNLPDAFNEAWLICFSLLGCLGVWLAFVPAYLTTGGHHAATAEALAVLGSTAALLSGMCLPKCYILLLRPDLNTREHLMGRGKGSNI